MLEEYTGEQRESLLASFPYLEKGPLVVLRNYSSATEAEKKALAQILEEAGYDAEQYERDAAFYAGKQNRQDNPGFRFSLCYRLQGDALIVSLPARGAAGKKRFSPAADRPAARPDARSCGGLLFAGRLFPSAGRQRLSDVFS